MDVKLNTDYFTDELPEYDKVIYTGPIDRFFDYRYGELEYKTTRFNHRHLETENFQGTALMNFTEEDKPHTRIIEHKYFENNQTDTTWVTWEYPTEYVVGKTEPYYPVNDSDNNSKYEKYKLDAKKLDNIYFGGRLAEYKYYDMHQVIESALNFVNDQL